MNFKILEARLFDSVTSVSANRTIKDYEIDIELGNGRIYSYGDIFEKRLSCEMCLSVSHTVPSYRMVTKARIF